MSIRWPPLVVRTWQGVLYSRYPEDYWIESEHDDVQEAIESRPLHELRGLVIGQVAEIEGLLLYIASEIRARHSERLPSRQKQRGAGGALRDLRQLLSAMAIDDEVIEALETIWQVVQRRNKLVHGRIHVGFSRVGERSPLEPVIVLLFENDGNGESVPSADDDSEDVECGEYELKKYLNEAYIAMEAALDIWMRVDEALPNK